MKLLRREFVIAAGVTVAGIALGGCSPTTQSSQPGQVSTPAKKSRVALVVTSDRAHGVREAIKLLDENRVKDKAVLLKPNFNNADPTPASTHPDVLRELVKQLQAAGARQITIGERSGGGTLGTTGEVFEALKVPALAKELGVGLINFQDANEWVPFKREGLNWKNGFHIAKAVADAESVVTTCCLKTHAYGGIFTLSLKNSVGIVPLQGFDYMRDLHRSSEQRRMIAEINLAYTPDLVVVDGVEAFTTGGPNSGTRVNANVVFAGRDRVAIDAVGVAMLRILGSTPEIMNTPVFKQEQIARAVELGLGAASAAEIEVVTGDAEGERLAKRIIQEMV